MTAAMGTEPQQALASTPPVGALWVVRWSARYEETVTFYRDAIRLPVLETFHDSYGLDGTILGLPGGLDQLVFYLMLPPGSSWRRGSPSRVPARCPRSTAGKRRCHLPTTCRTSGKWCSHPGSKSCQDLIARGQGRREALPERLCREAAALSPLPTVTNPSSRGAQAAR